jgi:hypothetical protein
MGACPSPSSHRGQPREYSDAPRGAWTVRPRSKPRSRGATAAGEINVGPDRVHRRLEILASRPRLRRRISERGSLELLQDLRGSRESGIADGDEEVELALPRIEVGLLGGRELLRRVQLAQRVHDVLVETGVLVDEDRHDGHAILARRDVLEPDPEISTEPSFLDVGRLARPLELREVIVPTRPGVGVPAASDGGDQQDGEQPTDPHDRQRASDPSETATPLKESRSSSEIGRMPHRDLRVVLEWLGFVEPDRSRREPIALPSWAPWVVTFSLVAAAALGAVAITALLGLLS